MSAYTIVWRGKDGIEKVRHAEGDWWVACERARAYMWPDVTQAEVDANSKRLERIRKHEQSR